MAAIAQSFSTRLSMSNSRQPPGRLELPPESPTKDSEGGRMGSVGSLSSIGGAPTPAGVSGADGDPNAKSVEVSVAESNYTDGQVNQHPASVSPNGYHIGVSEDRNRKCRRTMEDAHAFVYDFGGVKGQGYFAIFDGHAGKHAAEWCGKHFHEYLLEGLRQHPKTPVPDLLNSTFHIVDHELSRMAIDSNTHSGCTAVTAFLRLEDQEGNPVGERGGVSEDALGSEKQKAAEFVKNEKEGTLDNKAKKDLEKGDTSQSGGNSGEKERSNSSSINSEPGDKTMTSKEAADLKAAKRTLYTANVGDARAVLCRGGKAVRLTYDHKGSDAQEAKRITDAGGFVMNNRVNGVLAVTRSLGDSAMKEFVVGSPYTTETSLTPLDEFLIIACDGLWDVCEDQKAVDLVRESNAVTTINVSSKDSVVKRLEVQDPQEASRILLDHALQNFSTDNLSAMVVAF